MPFNKENEDKENPKDIRLNSISLLQRL